MADDILKHHDKISLSYGNAASLFKKAAPMLRPVPLGVPSLTALFTTGFEKYAANKPNERPEQFLENTLNIISLIVSNVEAAAQVSDTETPEENDKRIAAVILDEDKVSTSFAKKEILDSFLETRKAFHALKERSGGATVFSVEAPSRMTSLQSFFSHINPLVTTRKIYNAHAFKKSGINAFFKK